MISLLFIETFYIAHLLSLALTSLGYIIARESIKNYVLSYCPNLSTHIKISVFLTALLIVKFFYGFLTSDYQINYVFSHSDSSLAWFFKIAALWSGQEGSTLLLFFFVQFFFLINIIIMPASMLEKVTNSPLIMVFIYLQMILMNIYHLNGDLLVLNIPFTPISGQDLNPLLKDYAMTYHPPLLLAGQAIFFSACFLQLINRHFTLTPKEKCLYALSIKLNLYSALAVLSFGITFGSLWAYHVLGWGGYWFWDPVESLSLIPWLWGFAWLHALERKNIYFDLLWPVIIFGLIVVRSDALVSVHSFAQNVSGRNLLLGLFAVFPIVQLYQVTTTNPIHLRSKLVNSKTIGALTLGTAVILILMALAVPIAFSYISAQAAHIDADFFQMSLSAVFWSALAWVSTSSFNYSYRLFLTTAVAVLFYTRPLTYIHLLAALALTYIPFHFKIWPKKGFVHFIATILAITIVVNSLYQDKQEFLVTLEQPVEHSNYRLTAHRAQKVVSTENLEVYRYPVTFISQDFLKNTYQVVLYPAQEIHPISGMWTSKMVTSGNKLGEYCFIVSQVVNDNQIYLTILYQPAIFFIWLLGIIIALYCLINTIFLFRQHYTIRYNN